MIQTNAGMLKKRRDTNVLNVDMHQCGIYTLTSNTSHTSVYLASAKGLLKRFAIVSLKLSEINTLTSNTSSFDKSSSHCPSVKQLRPYYSPHTGVMLTKQTTQAAAMPTSVCPNILFVEDTWFCKTIKSR